MATCIILQTQRQLDLTFHPNILAVFPEPDGSRLWHARCNRTGYESPYGPRVAQGEQGHA
jgi:hypothetical protein